MYADIIVDISVEDLDRTFQYRIPGELEASVHVGSKVSIPFGKGNRQINGFVVGISDEAKIPEEKIKDIASLNLKDLTIEDRMIELAFWMKEHFASTTNEALKCVIPVKRAVKNKVRKIILPAADRRTIEEELESSVKKHHTAKEKFLRELLTEYDEGLKYELITEKMNISPATVGSLEKKGLIKVETSTVFRDSLGMGARDAGSVRERIDLNEEQQRISDDIIGEYNRGIRGKYLLHGITGSGKTEVYLSVIDEVVKQGKSVIMLIPEIALTYQTVKRFYKRFGDGISVINSRLSAGERYDQYLKAKNGETKIVIGPRSAVFTPFDNLGLIIIDEEHEGSYKSENSPKYSTREVAFFRAEKEGAAVILGSATPSLESYFDAQEGRIKLYELKTRAGGAELPKVHVVDLKEELKARNRSIFSRKLRELIEDRLNRHEQVMLFINRRGHSGFVNCRACGNVIKCPHCDVSLTYHVPGKLVCHYCGYETGMVSSCPKCASPYVSTFGTGTQKIEELINKEYPLAKTLRMDYDTTRAKESYDDILSAFANHEADILIGTQMIVKGHDFHDVTLVGIILADMSLYQEDFRCAEKTFQLLSQAAGRAGRGQKAGEVVIQTYNPEHYAIESSALQDYGRFYDEEIDFRRLMKYPPVWTMLKIMLSSEDEEELLRETDRVDEFLKGELERLKAAVKLFGPSKARIYRVNDVYRMVFYLKWNDYSLLSKLKDKLSGIGTLSKEVSLQFDFNPL